MRKLRFALAAAAVGLLAPVAVMSPASAAASPAAPASARPAASAALPTLTVGSPTGPAVNPGDILSSSLTSGTVLSLTTSPGGGVGLFCKQSTWQATSLTNPAVGGPAANRLTSLTIAACTDNNPGVASVTGVGVTNLPDILQVTGTGAFPIQILPSGAPLQIVATLLLSTGATAVCTYQSNPPINGTTGLGSVPWSFTNQPFTLISGGPISACGAQADFFTASYSPVIDVTQLGKTVYVN
jgi:hypothetical protein